MGNVPSVEGGPGSDRRTAHKLSKPRTVNHATAGLLSPQTLEDPRRRFSTGRAVSLPYGTSPAPSPMFPPSETGLSSQAEEQDAPVRSRSRSISRSASALFRSKSSQARPKNGFSVMSTPSQSTRPSRANSMIIGASEAAYHAHAGPIGLQRAGSRNSVNYDLNSYEAKRLLNLTEERSYENNSVISESHFHVAETWKNPLPQLRTEPAEATTMPRVNSDLSLYTPMRRRSLLTPGVATRAPTPSIPQKSRARHSLPSTPSRRQSLESMGIGALSIPEPSFISDSIPRVVTPCESDYRHTGAFKLGSLRITNGSPLRSPAVDHTRSNAGKSDFTTDRDYFRQNELATKPTVVTSGLNIVTSEFNVGHRLQVSILSPSLQSPSSGNSTSSPKRVDLPMDPRESLEYLPELHLSPLSFGASDTSPLELQITSKHTAVEDDLFEDEEPEFTHAEILDIRVDLNAKSLPPRPRLISEGRNARDMTRSDSGVVATPISEYSHKSLAKTDSGYSSNVSLRSFSAKPPIPEKDQRRATELEIPPKTPAKDTFSSEAAVFLSPKGSISEDATAKSLEEVPPPPVPEKDKPAESVRTTSEIPPATRQISRLDQIRASVKSRSSPLPINSSDCQANENNNASKLSPRSPLSPTSSTNSASTWSFSGDSRKSGKLQRFLSGAKIPLITHTSHRSEKNGAPPTPQEAEAKLSEHAGLSLLSQRSSGPKVRPSRETLGTILSVGSAEASYDENVPPVPSLPKIAAFAIENHEESRAQNSVDTSSLGPTLAPVTTSTVPVRKPIIRKPLPTRNFTQKANLESENIQNDVRLQAVDSNSAVDMAGDTNLSAAFLAMAGEREAYFTPTNNAPTRPKTMTAQVERDIEMRYSALGPSVNSSSSRSMVPGPTSAALRLNKTKTPPPVSMRTRNSSVLRVPPPLRAQSTPPDATAIRSGLPLSRKTSRETIHSYPAAVDVRPQPSLARRSSRENVHSYPPAQEQYQHMQRAMTTPPVDFRRSLSFVTNSGEHRRPNWEVQTDHDTSSQRGSFDRGRRDSVSSQASQQGYRVPRPRSHSQYSNFAPPQLRQRASYDAYNHGQAEVDVEDLSQGLYRDNGPYPVMPAANGHAYISDPWSGRPMPLQCDQQGRYPPYVPRGHSRNRSMGAPYRVLHSYNSPAYKNVPIWG